MNFIFRWVTVFELTNCYCSLVVVNHCWLHFSSRKHFLSLFKALSIRPCVVVYFVPKRVVVANWVARFEGVLNKCELPIKVMRVRVWGVHRGPNIVVVANCWSVVPWSLNSSWSSLLKCVASPGLTPFSRGQHRRGRHCWSVDLVWMKEQNEGGLIVYYLYT